MATPAPACKKALADATKRWPNRNRASDGILGDQAHQARKSDHNLGNAFDLTHDPAHGVDCAALTHPVSLDPRVTYIIFRGMIYKRYKPELGWRNYTGPNRHDKHMHVSIKPESRNDLSPWPWSVPSPPPIGDKPTLRAGDQGQFVELLQCKLKIEADGQFGPKTLAALKAFQKSKGLTQDGIAGKDVWAALG